MLLRLTDINKFYNGNQVLSHVSLTIEDRDRIGLIGVNGCGKSTLLRIITEHAPIERIFCNGNTSLKYYRRYNEPLLGRPAVVLPSTSPANAAWSLQRLAEAWRVIL